MCPGSRPLLIAVVAAAMTSCGLFDSGIEWRGGPYALLWIDEAENISLCRDLGEGSWSGRVDATVFAVGWNGKYVVAKQHPQGDRSRTHYFIVDASKDTTLADPPDVVIGPLDKAQYDRKASELHLPAFTKVLRSLE